MSVMSALGERLTLNPGLQTLIGMMIDSCTVHMQVFRVQLFHRSSLLVCVCGFGSTSGFVAVPEIDNALDE